MSTRTDSTIWGRFQHLMRRHGWDGPNDGILVGVSGGSDSVALLDLLARLAARGGPSVSIFHLDHQIRGKESADDAAFVEELAVRYGFPHRIFRFDVRRFARREGRSLEEAGRMIRLHFLRRLAPTLGCGRAALAHTADDQAETFFLHLFRGAGRTGLAGMSPAGDGFVIRPLLPFTRADVLAYCRARGLTYRTDSTNASRDPLRNRIRADLLPLIEERYAPGLRRTLVRTMRLLSDEEAWMELAAADAFQAMVVEGGGGIRLPASGLRGLPPALQRRIVRRAMRRVMGTVEGVTLGGVDEVRHLLERPPGRRVELGKRLLVEHAHGFLSFWRHPDGEREASGVPETGYQIAVPGSTFLPAWNCRIEAFLFAGSRGISSDDGPARPLGSERGDSLSGAGGVSPTGGAYRIRFDYVRLPLPVVVRARRPGDRIRLAGIGHRKLSDILIDRKVPRAVRSRLPVVEGGGAVLWLAGLSPVIVADRVTVTSATTRVLELSFGRMEGNETDGAP